MSSYQFSQILEAMLVCFVGTVIVISMWAMAIITEIREHPESPTNNKTEDL